MRNRITGLIAPKGSGKTYKAVELVNQLPCVVVFDLLHESGYLACADHVITGNPKQCFEVMRDELQFRIVYRPTKFDFSDEQEYCPEFARILKLSYLRGNCCFVIDEAHQLCNARSCPVELLYSVRLGRHRQLDLLYITQSFSAVSRAITENTDEFYFWKIIEPKDVDGIRARCGSDVSERVQNLKRLGFHENGRAIPGEFVRWTAYDGIVETAGEIQRESPGTESS